MSSSLSRRTQYRIKILGFFIIFFFLTIKFSDYIVPSNGDYSQIIKCESGSCDNSTANNNHSKSLLKYKTGKKSTPPFTIVTGASANHFCELQSWLYYMSEISKELREEYRPRIIVYDIGMMEYQKKILNLLKNKGGYFNEFNKFNFDKYPKFWDVNENRGEYAWKPGIVKEVSMKYPGIIIWLDSGSFLSRDFFSKIEKSLIQYNGFISPKSSGKLLKWTHPGVFKYFKKDIKDFINKDYNNCNGAAIIFNTKKTQYLIDQWYECALVKECIAPEGSSRENHRQDQAILTYLIINDNRSCDPDKSFFGIKIHMDNQCARNIYYYDKLHGEFYWPSSEDLEEINRIKELYVDHIIYDIWSEGALEKLLASFTESSLLEDKRIETETDRSTAI